MRENNNINNIKRLTGKRKSVWAKAAKYSIENSKWLNWSAAISLRIQAALDDKETLQTNLASSLKMKPQQISRLLKGHQNLTLKTIAKISDVLEFDLISFPPYKDSFIKLQSGEVTPYKPNTSISTTGKILPKAVVVQMPAKQYHKDVREGMPVSSTTTSPILLATN